jgi:hypothetical protein
MDVAWLAVSAIAGRVLNDHSTSERTAIALDFVIPAAK